MKWTKDAPTKAGWYWWLRKNVHIDYPIRGVTEIRIFESGPFIWSPSSEETWKPISESIVDLWSEKIEPPESE